MFWVEVYLSPLVRLPPLTFHPFISLYLSLFFSPLPPLTVYQFISHWLSLPPLPRPLRHPFTRRLRFISAFLVSVYASRTRRPSSHVGSNPSRGGSRGQPSVILSPCKENEQLVDVVVPGAVRLGVQLLLLQSPRECSHLITKSGEKEEV